MEFKDLIMRHSVLCLLNIVRDEFYSGTTFVDELTKMIHDEKPMFVIRLVHHC